MLTGCVLITGTSRGIGLELTRQLLQRSSVTPKYIIATCRNPGEADDLMRLRDQHPQTVIIKELDDFWQKAAKLGRTLEEAARCDNPS